MRISRRAAFGWIAGGGIGLATGTAAYGFTYARHDIQVVRASVPVSGLPPALEGVRLGLITDLHHSALVPREDVEEAVALVMAERPDLIVLGGDYVTRADQSFMAPCAEALGALRAPHGEIAPILKGAGSPVVLIAHDPRRLRQAADLDIGLVLSGHTHGGQVVLPVLVAV